MPGYREQIWLRETEAAQGDAVQEREAELAAQHHAGSPQVQHEEAAFVSEGV